MNMVFKLIIGVIPYILIGWLFTKLKLSRADKCIKYFVNFALYFLIPVFIFFAMWKVPFRENLNNSKIIVLTASVVIFLGIAFAMVYSRIFHMKFKDVSLPVIFMNSAYLAIPVNTIFFGEAGTFYSIMYNVTILILHFTIGIWIVSGSVKEIFCLPVLYAAGLGIFMNLAGIKTAAGLVQFSKMLNAVTLPVMLCLVGYQIKPISFVLPGGLKKVFVGVFIRMVGGFVVAFSFCEVLGITGAVRGVCLLSSSMPPAVNTYILTKKYGADFSFASSMIVIGLIMSLILIPVVLWML